MWQTGRYLPLLTTARNDLFNEKFRFENLNIVNTHVLLWGDSSISNTDNKHLFNLVQHYIKASERFQNFLVYACLYIEIYVQIHAILVFIYLLCT